LPLKVGFTWSPEPFWESFEFSNNPAIVSSHPGSPFLSGLTQIPPFVLSFSSHPFYDRKRLMGVPPLSLFPRFDILKPGPFRFLSDFLGWRLTIATRKNLVAFFF